MSLPTPPSDRSEPCASSDRSEGLDGSGRDVRTPGRGSAAREPARSAAGAPAPAASTPELRPGQLARAVEALLVVLDAPLRPAEAARSWQVAEQDVVAAVRELAATCLREDRGYVVRETASGWRMYAAPDLTDILRTAVVGEITARLSPAALETLAVVAYQQPVSRSRVAAVRGVSVDAVMRTLSTRGLVTDVSVDPASGATLYATTELFLELLGLSSLGDLPELAPLLPDITELVDTHV